MNPASVNRDNLRSAVRALEPLADLKSPLIYRTAVEVESKKEKINLRVSDSESETEVSVPKKGGSDFSLLIQTRVFRRALDAFEDERVSISKDEDELLLENDHSRSLALASIDNSRLPDRLEKGRKLASGNVNAFDMSRALNRAIKIAQSADSARPIINSVVFKRLRFLEKDYLNIVATDGHRLIEAPIEIEDMSGNLFENIFIWPIASVKALATELQRIGKNDPNLLARVSDFENIAEVSFNSTSWRSAGMNGTYPDTDSIFQSARGDNILYFDKKEMVKSLKALSSISVGDAPAVLKLTDKLEIDYQVPGMARFEETLKESAYQGKSQEIAFNHQYLSELCQLIDGDEFFDGLKSENQIKARIPSDANAVLFYGDEFVRVLLMPIRH